MAICDWKDGKNQTLQYDVKIDIDLFIITFPFVFFERFCLREKGTNKDVVCNCINLLFS